jgi:hypothetical protein
LILHANEKEENVVGGIEVIVGVVKSFLQVSDVYQITTQQSLSTFSSLNIGSRCFISDDPFEWKQTNLSHVDTVFHQISGDLFVGIFCNNNRTKKMFSWNLRNVVKDFFFRNNSKRRRSWRISGLVQGSITNKITKSQVLLNSIECWTI